ncbi:MAG TPA: hypothetical protein VGC08_14305, partial [Pedobacter sp.]
LSESPNLSEKDPADLATLLQLIFGIGALFTIILSSYWYYYGNLESTAGELKKAKQKWNMLFFLELIISIALTVIIVVMNLTEGIEASWYSIYFAVNAFLTFILFWLTTFLMSPRTVKFIPFGK